MRDRIEQGAETVGSLSGQLRDLLNELGGRLAERTSDDSEEDEQADGGRQGGGEAQCAAHPRHEGFKEDRDRKRDRNRHDDDGELGSPPEEDRNQPDNDQRTPREGGGDAQGARHHRGGVALIRVIFSHRQKNGRGGGSPLTRVSIPYGQNGAESSHQVG